VKIEYKVEDHVGLQRIALTPCPFNCKTASGSTVAVGSVVCDFCRNHKGKQPNERGGIVECSAWEESWIKSSR